ncbi:MFS transporter [Rhodococcus sp. 06-156-3C]|uniref:MFS transporter n=1 Tax=Nocardiaceae TaxID=85025 RepID=UPI000522E7CD|nr:MULTISPECIES: MFS transporter [Rhodococcus]OZD13058.1 MFS transporter [Rhodococcus sp. 06-156-4a]OZD17927.1 MFS transporter [Rhodococcus sp. 06-156-3C]OZD20651.1 MFS transporter [Rhodococcus sp. 06-156-4C]OZD30631.1 MFS transporter [Rhodococcus sp. 06-156-3b]OZD32597.1 MFS transporter [Rhodococcus sp. 06-156-3]
MAPKTEPAATTSAGTTTDASEANQNSMPRVASASFVGSLIEFYDFNIYGVAAALVFGEIFFPALGPAAATVAAFATLGVAFVARPVGSILFGHFGDKLGRKRTLVITLMMMGFATVAVGLMPTADQIGIAAPIMLVVLRIIQGLAAGGEWAGAALFVTENAPKGKRGFWAMFASLGGGFALTLAPATFLLTGLFLTDEQFLSFGWRIPFIASTVLIAVGMYIRLRMEETPVFKAEELRKAEVRRTSSPQTVKVIKAPFFEAFRSQPKEIILASLTMIIPPSFGYLGASYLVNYGANTLDLSRNAVLGLGALGGAALTSGIFFGGTYSDRIGRRRVIIGAASVAVVWALVLFPILDIAANWTFAIGMVVTMAIGGVALGPMSAFMSELFETRYRYTAAGFSYNVAQIIGGATVPLLAASIIAAFGGFVFGLLLAALAVVSLLSAVALKETKDLEMDRV